MTLVFRRTVCFVALAFILAIVANAAPSAYVGSYTPEPTARAENHGDGIYFTNVSPLTGAPDTPRLVAKVLSPSWLALSADRKFLYATSEILAQRDKEGGLVTSFIVDSATGALRQLNVVSSIGPGPSYVSMHPSGKFVMVSNYYGGSFTVISIRPDGSLGDTTDFVQLPPTPPSYIELANAGGRGGFAPRPPVGGARGHMIAPDPSGQFVIGNDAGRDHILVWQLNATTGKLTEVSRTTAEQGAGPRHFVFSADGRILYQLQEQNARLAVYDFSDGHLTLKQAPISTLPPDYKGTATTSELLISRDGKYLYSANRGPDSIAVWSVDAAGLVRRVADVSTQGRTPRSLTLDPTGQYLYAMNQRSDTIATFRIDPKTGVPHFTGSTVSVGTPAVMIFLSE